MMWDQISEQISQATGEPFQICDRHAVGGGCINQGYQISQGSVIILLNSIKLVK